MSKGKRIRARHQQEAASQIVPKDMLLDDDDYDSTSLCSHCGKRLEEWLVPPPEEAAEGAVPIRIYPKSGAGH